mgnify:CR=1 FL=1
MFYFIAVKKITDILLAFNLFFPIFAKKFTTMKCNFNFFFSGKICGFIIVLTTMLFSLNAQTSPPESISYQGIARDVSGNILSNQPIGIQFIIHQGSAGGTSVFTEQHSVTTNSLGLFTLQIGSVNTSAFSSINWANGPYYLEVQMDPNGGTSYTSVGTQQMLSVPYALYAKNSYSATYALASFTTANAPPISITTNTSSTDATITVSQGTNSSSATINFPPAPTPMITITGNGITAVTPTTGTSFAINTPSPSLSINTNTTTGISTLTLTQGAATSTASIPSPTNYAWGLSGNAGTNPSTNFLGTTDNNGLIFKTNNFERMRISSGGGISIGTTTLCSGCILDVAGKIGVNVNTSYGLISRSGLSGGTYTVPGNAGVMGMFDYSSGSGAGIAGVTTNSAAAGSYAVYGSAALPSHFSAYFSGGKNYFEKEVGIGITSPNYPLHTVYSGTAGAGHYIDYTCTSFSGSNSSIIAHAISTSTGSIYGGYFWVSGSSTSSNATAVKASATSSATVNYGIDASATGTTTGTNYGGYFNASGGNTNFGVYSVINATNAASSAIYAASAGSNGSAGKFEITNNSNTSPVLHVKNIFSSNPLAIFEGAGFVGIGTTSPQSFLHIQSPNSAQTNILQIGNWNQPTLEWIFDVDGAANLRIKNENTASPYLYLGPTSSNIVGINTSNSIGSADFVVSFNGAHSGFNYAGMYVNSDVNGKPFYGYAKAGSPSAWTYVDPSNNWVVNVGSFDRMYITNAGDVMISNTNAYKFTSPKTYTLTIPAYAFNPESPAYSYTTVSGNIGPTTGTLTLTAGYACYFDAPLNLPANATVTTLQALVYDNSTSYNIGQVQIFQNDYSTFTAYGSTTSISPSLSTAGNNTNLQLISGAVTPSLVINPNYGYWVRVHLPYDTGGNIRLASVKIVYQVLETD